MWTVAMFFRLPVARKPAVSRPSTAGIELITTSAVSPASSRFCSAPTVPKLNSTSWPVSLVKS
jgi:hypothetical protein